MTTWRTDIKLGLLEEDREVAGFIHSIHFDLSSSLPYICLTPRAFKRVYHIVTITLVIPFYFDVNPFHCSRHCHYFHFYFPITKQKNGNRSAYVNIALEDDFALFSEHAVLLVAKVAQKWVLFG